METICFYEEFLVPVPRDRLFRAAVIDGDNLTPKLLPHVFKSMDTIDGDGGPGTIKRTVFNEESGLRTGDQLYRIDVLDSENFIYRITLIEGSSLFERVESVVYEVTYADLGNNNCVVRVATEYHPKRGLTLKEEDIMARKTTTIGFYKIMVAYLMANPDAYM
ncbi:hypothetical protein CDL15_Pgr016695 [Punica granatum]|uniref:Bet v I/Major latex protein domain-containing protein n=1 Tax=Punica granatum TaxID=22663 RepID=A0A218XV24_PUNGR|nr:hypothetical protein CDL15_Pgr016695 [Punica granatum]PKI40748.1 hypothetical protein CRG98_038859 [Punica granatum]